MPDTDPRLLSAETLDEVLTRVADRVIGGEKLRGHIDALAEQLAAAEHNNAVLNEENGAVHRRNEDLVSQLAAERAATAAMVERVRVSARFHLGIAAECDQNPTQDFSRGRAEGIRDLANDILALLPASGELGEARDGAGLITTERKRQVNVEGWTPAHDAAHRHNELLQAAICYITTVENNTGTNLQEPNGWPWEFSWWKPSADPIRNLVKAGALIAAEIDRLAAEFCR